MKVRALSQSGNQDMLGNGPRTISQAGCLLTCFAMAANTLNGTRLGVSQTNDILRQAKAFIGSGLYAEKACRRLDLKMKRTEAVPADVFDTLEDGHALVIIGVDYKPGRSSGFSDADHFVLAYALGKTSDGRRTVIAADPATGSDVHFEEERVVGGTRLVCVPSPRVTWRAAETIYLTSAGA